MMPSGASAEWGSGGIREIGKSGPPLTVDKKAKQPPKKRDPGPGGGKREKGDSPSSGRKVDLEA